VEELKLSILPLFLVIKNLVEKASRLFCNFKSKAAFKNLMSNAFIGYFVEILN
jgi:hypothetical protein